MAMRVAPARRQFLADAARMASGVAIGTLALGLAARAARALPPTACRPPGARDEADFLGACIRCGLCVRDCPPGILSLARLGDGVAVGTPYFVARSGPCEMCETLPCIKACPTGALDHELTEVARSRMGLAVLVDRGTCLNFLGLRCDVCYRVCPLIDKAITLEPRHNARTGEHTIFEPVVHAEACTGCGKCEASCVLESAAIRVYPLSLARGKLGSHYRIGWEEKRKAGGSLVAPDVEHHFNLPEGMSYEQGRGVSAAPSAAGVDGVAVPRPGDAAPAARKLP